MGGGAEGIILFGLTVSYSARREFESLLRYNSLNIINILHSLKNDFEAFFPLHTSYTLFGSFPIAPDYIVFTVIG